MNLTRAMVSAALLAGAYNAHAATSTTEILSPLCGGIGKISAEVIEINGQSRLACELNPNITLENGDTLSSSYFGIPVAWVLNGIVKVGDGDRALQAGEVPSKVDLFVNEGVQFRSLDASALVVTRGSKIFVNGTAEKPVVMASKDDNFKGLGEWGGLVVQGFGITNVCGTAGDVCNIEAEGVSFGDVVSYYGGFDNTDSSGSISHLIIAESGFDVAGSLDPDRSGNEINGLTLVGVGSGTAIDNVQIVNGLDDGIEMFGGAVNVRDLTIAGISDDSIDYDLGYVGKLYNVVAKQLDRLDVDNSGDLVVLADHVVEASGQKGDDNALPLSNPIMKNLQFTSTGTDEALKFKEGTAGKFLNVSVTVGTDQLGGNKGCVEIKNQDDATDRVASGDLVVVSSNADCQLGDQSFDVQDAFFDGVPANFSWTLPESAYF